MRKKNNPELLSIHSPYSFDESVSLPLEPLLNEVRNQLVNTGYSESALTKTDLVINRLRKIASEQNTSEYTIELRNKLLEDCQYPSEGGFSGFRYREHRLLIHRIDSYIANGKIDFSRIKKHNDYLITKQAAFVEAYNTYQKSIEHLSKSAKRLYCRSVGYFLNYLDFEKGYTTLYELKKGDISTYIPKAASEHFPNSLSNMLTGLRGFLSLEELGIDYSFLMEIPAKIAKPRRILDPLSNDELQQITDTLDNVENDIPLRDRAITEVAIGTGYRSIDILSLTFSSFDWENDTLTIIQHKTGRSLSYPLTASIGNAVVDYLLHERPDSESDYIFLQMQAPYLPLTSNFSSWDILRKVFEKAKLNLSERPVGTRLTRHSRATYLLSKGVPLALIAQSLGHRNNSTVNVYLSTDEEHMADCILPLPIKQEVQ